MPPPVAELLGGAAGASGESKAQPLLSQVNILVRRAYTKALRDRDFWLRQLLVPLIQFLFYGLLFLGTRQPFDALGAGWSNEDEELAQTKFLIQAKRAFLFQILTAALVTETSVLAEAFSESRAFRREHAAGAYSAVAYHLQWAVRLSAQSVWKALLFGSIVFWWPYQFNPTADAFFYFLAIFALLASTGSSFSLLIISFIPDPEGAGAAHNAIASVLLQFSGFFLLPCLMPPVISIPYFISFGKYAFEGLLQNEFDAPTGSRYTWYARQSMDPSWSRWTNMMMLCLYPLVFHGLAFGFTFFHTRPRSFWTRLSSSSARLREEERARVGAAPPSLRCEA